MKIFPTENLETYFELPSEREHLKRIDGFVRGKVAEMFHKELAMIAQLPHL